MFKRLEFINHLFETEKRILFKSIDQNEISVLYKDLLNLTKEIHKNYSNDIMLQDSISDFIKQLRRFFSTFDVYEFIFNEYLDNTIGNIARLKIQYPTLFESNLIPIIKKIINIKEHNFKSNFFQDEILKMHQEKKIDCIVTRYKSEIKELDGIPIIKASQLMKDEKFYERIVFIGSPQFYDSRSSIVFIAKETIFLSYSIFNNDLTMEKENEVEMFSTLYNKVSFGQGVAGQIFKEDFGLLVKELDTESIIEKQKREEVHLREIDKIQVQLIVLRNGHYTFAPTETLLISFFVKLVISSVSPYLSISFNNLCFHCA